MNRRMILSGAFSAFLLASSLAHAAASSGGSDGTRGGGDDVGIEFSATARVVLDELKTVYAAEFPELDLDRLEKTITGARYAVSEVLLPVLIENFEQQSLAINDPSTQTIYINRNRWNGLKDEQTRKTVVLHELLGLMGLEGTGNYSLSARYQALRVINKEIGGTAAPLVGAESPSLDYDIRESWENSGHFGTGIEVHSGGTRVLFEVGHPGIEAGQFRYFMVEAEAALGTFQDGPALDRLDFKITPIQFNPFAMKQELVKLDLMQVSYLKDLHLGVGGHQTFRAIGISIHGETRPTPDPSPAVLSDSVFFDWAASALGYAMMNTVDGKIYSGPPVTSKFAIGINRRNQNGVLHFEFLGIETEGVNGAYLSHDVHIGGMDFKFREIGFSFRMGGRSVQYADRGGENTAYVRVNVVRKF